MTPHGPLAAAILAGGLARRLDGRRKAFLPIGGVPIIEHQLRVLRQVADPVFVVAQDAAPFEPLRLRVVSDRIPARGALGGIYTAVVESPHDRVLVVGCDMPFLPVALLEAMARSTAEVVIPRGPRGLEPLCAIYGRRCAAPMRARIDAGRLEASVLPEGMRVEEIGPEALAVYDPDGLMFVNVNTPHDYERAQELADSPSRPARDRIMDER